MSADDDYNAIHKALHTGQASAKKIDAQRALVRLGEMLDRIKRHGLITGTPADARALWAVRVLDAEAIKRRGRVRSPEPEQLTPEFYAWWCNGACGASPAAARIAAATALVAADPSLEPTI